MINVLHLIDVYLRWWFSEKLEFVAHRNWLYDRKGRSPVVRRDIQLTDVCPFPNKDRQVLRQVITCFDEHQRLLRFSQGAITMLFYVYWCKYEEWRKFLAELAMLLIEIDIFRKNCLLITQVAESYLSVLSPSCHSNKLAGLQLLPALRASLPWYSPVRTERSFFPHSPVHMGLQFLLELYSTG